MIEAKQVWEDLKLRKERGKKADELAAQYKLNLTTTQERSWYGDSWTEAVVDWPAVADLLDKVAPGWDSEKYQS